MENEIDLKRLSAKIKSQGILIQVLTEAVAVALNTTDPERSLEYLRRAQRLAVSHAADKALDRKITKLIAQARGKV